MRGKFILLVVVIFLGAYVLFGITDPVELFNGSIVIIKKLAEKGEWVKDIWAYSVKGDFKSAFSVILKMIENGNVGLLSFLLRWT